MNVQNEDEEVRYCVTAVLDLLGFAGHLEIAGNDLRTSIGREAVKRLELLEQALGLIAEERVSCELEYPETFHHIRINDAIIFSLDLPDLLKPSVGESVRKGMSAHDILKFFDIDQFEDDQEFRAAYEARLMTDVVGLVLFVGMLARLHLFINRIENSSFFPGARTVIATGYRRPFVTKRAEDFLSANFSFSNAYLAEKSLHGPNFYVDNNVSQLLCANRFAQNLLRFACYTSGVAQFDPYVDYEDVLSLRDTRFLTKPIELTLFRKSFQFRQLDPYPLAHLQLIPRLMSYLQGLKEPADGGKAIAAVARSKIRAMAEGPAVTADEPSAKSLGGMIFDLETDIRVLSELIESGQSPTLQHSMGLK